jgi:hypothetical protein
LLYSVANVSGKIIPPRKIEGIPKRNLNLISIVLLIGSIPYIKKPKSNECF